MQSRLVQVALAACVALASGLVFLTTITQNRLLERTPVAIRATEPPPPELRLQLIDDEFRIVDDAGVVVAHIPVDGDAGLFGSRAAMLDGPGGPRLIVGAPFASDIDLNAGAVWFFDADAIVPALDATVPIVIEPAQASLVLDGSGANSLLGAGLVDIPDANADGVEDVLIGEPGTGAAYILSGADGAIIRTLGGDAGESFGVRVDVARDQNGDAVDEHVVLSTFLDPAYNTRGRRWIFDGATGDLLSVDDTADAPITRLAGDLDLDSGVTDDDLSSVLLAVGTTADTGDDDAGVEDINGDATIDSKDVDLVLRDFGDSVETVGNLVAMGVYDDPCWWVEFWLRNPDCWGVGGGPELDDPTLDDGGGDDSGDGSGDGSGGSGGSGGGGGGGGGGTTGSCERLIGPMPAAGRVLDRGAAYTFATGDHISTDCEINWSISAGDITILTPDRRMVDAVFTDIGAQTITSGCNCTTQYHIREIGIALDNDPIPHPDDGEPPFHLLLVNDDDDNGNGELDHQELSGPGPDDDWVPLTLGPTEGASGGGIFDPHWSLSTGPGVRVWYRADEGDLHEEAGFTSTPVKRVLDGVEYRVVPPGEFQGIPNGTRTYFAEAIAPSSSVADTWIECAVFGTASIVPSGQTEPVEYWLDIRNRVEVSAVAVDLDIDSDNTGLAATPDRSVDEESAEASAAGMKVIIVNRDDADRDDIPDYADGFNAFGPASSGGMSGRPFTPLHLEVAGLPNVPGIVLQFEYSAADPRSLSRSLVEVPDIQLKDDAGTLAPLSYYEYDRGDELLRIWRKDAGVNRTPADFIKTNTPLDLATLERDTALFVEAVNGSPNAVPIDIVIKHGDQLLLKDSVRVLPFDSVTGLYETEIAGFTIHQGSTSGTDGHDIVIGSEGPDIISTGQGEDLVVDGGGDDVISTGGGGDTVWLWGGHNDVDLEFDEDFAALGDGPEPYDLGDVLLADLAREPVESAAIKAYHHLHGASDPWLELFNRADGEVRFVDASWLTPTADWDWIRDSSSEFGGRPIIKIEASVREPFRKADLIRSQIQELTETQPELQESIDSELLARIVAMELESDGAVVDFIELQQTALENSIRQAAAVANIYLEGFRIISTPADVIISVGEVSDGDLLAGLNVLPFVSSSVTAGLKVTVMTATGVLLAEKIGKYTKVMGAKVGFKLTRRINREVFEAGNRRVVLLGKPQWTKKGDAPTTHAFTVKRRSTELAMSGQYSQISMNCQWDTIIDTAALPTGVKWNTRPDIIAVRWDGTVDVIEVLSPTNDVDDVERKVRAVLDNLQPPLVPGTYVAVDPDP